MCWKHYGPHSRKEPSRQHEFIRLAKAFWVERQRLSDHIASLERAQNGRKGLEVGRGPFHNCLCVFVCVCVSCSTEVSSQRRHFCVCSAKVPAWCTWGGLLQLVAIYHSCLKL